MRYYVIGIGGTGAKCVEAIAHLCAAGLMPAGELYALFVDPDIKNGNLNRAQAVLRRYIDLQLGATELLQTRIVLANPDFWTPFGDERRPKLSDFFKYHTLKADKKQIKFAHLFDVLYSEEEKEAELDIGFRGRPSIGAAVMAKTVQLEQAEPWKTFRDRIAQDAKGGDGARIFLIGSIFGGTGAAGFPTIARLIKQELENIGAENVKLGGALMLPYFAFPPVNSAGQILARSENFLMKTQAALKYYNLRRNMECYDTVYLLGAESPGVVSSDGSGGGETQRNAPHFIELYAALAARHFFMSNPSTARSGTAYFRISRSQANSIDWTDLPDGNNGTTVKHKLGQLCRFAFAYLGVYFPMLDSLAKGERKGYTAPWFVDFFERERINTNAEKTRAHLDFVKAYCEDFLLWLASVQTSGEDDKINLIGYNAFARVEDKQAILKNPEEFRLQEFGNLVLPLGRPNPHALSQLWARMCQAKVKDPNAEGVGKFIHALYQESRLTEG